jgi:hypothetical protein
MLAATAAVYVARGTTLANLILVSLTVMAVGLAAMAFYQTLSPLVGAEEAPAGQTLEGRARLALDREKTLVLRSIKELEFDRAMGKVADADFAEMVGRLRARAISLMAKLDAEAAGYRGLIERDLQARLAQAGVTAVSEARMEAPAGAAVPAGARAPSVLACSACGTGNDEDARFCKSCGAKLDANAVSM